MKFCEERLFEADRALFMNRKKGRVLPVKVVLKLISSHLKWPTKQTIAKSLADAVVLHLHEKNHDSATVTDISLRLPVL